MTIRKPRPDSWTRLIRRPRVDWHPPIGTAGGRGGWASLGCVDVPPPSPHGGDGRGRSHAKAAVGELADRAPDLAEREVQGDAVVLFLFYGENGVMIERGLGTVAELQKGSPSASGVKGVPGRQHHGQPVDARSPRFSGALDFDGPRVADDRRLGHPRLRGVGVDRRRGGRRSGRNGEGRGARRGRENEGQSK